NGELFVLGGQNTNTNTGEIYNPATNNWTYTANYPLSTFGAGPSEVLANGTVLVGDPNSTATYVYNPATNTWSSGPAKLFGDSSTQETWVKLPDGSILSYDHLGTAPQEAQRFIPSENQWIDAGTVPVSLTSTIGNRVGAAVLLPSG